MFGCIRTDRVLPKEGAIDDTFLRKLEQFLLLVVDEIFSIFFGLSLFSFFLNNIRATMVYAT
jgi:hypothetical protein